MIVPSLYVATHRGRMPSMPMSPMSIENSSGVSGGNIARRDSRIVSLIHHSSLNSLALSLSRMLPITLDLLSN